MDGLVKDFCLAIIIIKYNGILTIKHYFKVGPWGFLNR
jgi:hypothetical protein